MRSQQPGKQDRLYIMLDVHPGLFKAHFLLMRLTLLTGCISYIQRLSVSPSFKVPVVNKNYLKCLWFHLDCACILYLRDYLVRLFLFQQNQSNILFYCKVSLSPSILFYIVTLLGLNRQKKTRQLKNIQHTLYWTEFWRFYFAQCVTSQIQPVKWTFKNKINIV